jgi:nucleoside 2-deoxyribosyltransferase
MTQNLTLAIDGQGEKPTPMPLNAEQFAAACRQIVGKYTADTAHGHLDQLVTSLLNSLGYSEGMEIFMTNVVSAHKSIYLCGPINGCTDEECRDWREFIKTQWPGRCIDPMVRDYRGREAEAYREIVELDKIDVADADIILVNYDKPSVGTSMEVLFAWQIGKRVIVVCREDAVISPWLRYHAHHLCHSWADALRVASEA